MVFSSLHQIRPWLHRGFLSSRVCSAFTRTLTTQRPQQSAIRLPPLSWDSHMHVIGDTERYPLIKAAAYTPQSHTITEYLRLADSIRVENFVLVQPSIYGTDNSCLLDTLRGFSKQDGQSARGVVVLDPDEVDLQTLSDWHEIGVRGIRLNFKSVERTASDEDFNKELRKHADIAMRMNWVLQLFIPMTMIPALARAVDNLEVKICLDHFGCPDLRKAVMADLQGDLYHHDAFQGLLALVDAGRTWVKISAPYRLTGYGSSMEMSVFESMLDDLLHHGDRKKRVLWASDWPHTRFEGYDVRGFIGQCLEWTTGDTKLQQRLFVENAQELWK